MRERMRMFKVVPVLALALVLASCERPDTAGPELTTGPQAAMVVAEDGNDYTLIQGRIPDHIDDLQVSQLIGTDGGRVSLAGHRIIVPEGAVTSPTLFTMTLLTNGYVEVELTALEQVLNGLLGVQLLTVEEFQKPVTLELTYAWASNVEDPEDLVILRMNDSDGDHEVVGTRVEQDDQRPVVIAELDHFSRYCMAAN